MKTILSLCDFTGEWPRPYRENGYNIIQVDIKYGQDVIELASHPATLPPIHGVLAAPPCTHFTGSGARWWAGKDADGSTDELLKVAIACLDIIDFVKPEWWALENPIGRLPRLLPRIGRPVFMFNPSDYGDPYTKRTCLWGKFIPPLPLFIGGDWSVEPTEGSKMWAKYGGKSERTKAERSVTPAGFAKAFYLANP